MHILDAAEVVSEALDFFVLFSVSQENPLQL